MAAVLRENGFEAEILDCLPIRLGWKSLKQKLTRTDFDILCVGDETASAIESIKLAKFAKESLPRVKTIAGGFFFSYMEESALNEWGMDYVVRGEGEQTLLELVSYLDSKKDVRSYCGAEGTSRVSSLREINGLIYKDDDGAIVVNEDRSPVLMDSLPLPAYDLLPMRLYGRDSSNHRDFAAIEHGRGCTGGCKFCSIYALFSCKGKSHYRSKSARRSFAETELLVGKYGRKVLNWTDGTFNLDPDWSREYFSLLEQKGIKVQHTAWMRADFVVRDERLGIMKKMVDNGLIQAVVGAERLHDAELTALHKNQSVATTLEGFQVLKRYPEVLVIASLIYGLPDDTRESLAALWDMGKSGFADLIFLIPFTPYPGTEWWDRYKDTVEEKDFTKFNMHVPITGTKYLSRQQVNWWLRTVFLRSLFTPSLLLKRVMFEPDRRKRRVQRSMARKILKVLFAKMRTSIFPSGDLPSEYGVKPSWYNS